MTNLSVFEYNSVILKFDAELISLTSLWEMAGKPKEQTPNDWSSLPEPKKIINQVCRELNTDKFGVIKSKRGRGGGTWAHWKLALDYQKNGSKAPSFYDGFFMIIAHNCDIITLGLTA